MTNKGFTKILINNSKRDCLGDKKMELIPKKNKNIEEGIHKGVIIGVTYREEPYRYTDITIEVAGEDIERTYGCPTSAGMDSKLMSLLSKFTEVVENKPIDPEKVLVGQKITFMILHKEKEGKKFDRIVDESIKKLE